MSDNSDTVVVFDIDGTLANSEHRLHHITSDAYHQNWEAFYEAMGDDQPIMPMINLLLTFFFRDWTIVLCTGRPEKYRGLTEKWLERHGIIVDLLMMRTDGDHRDDNVIKREMLTGLRASGMEPYIVIEDRQRVVEMWRAEGITCLQCAAGNY